MTKFGKNDYHLVQKLRNFNNFPAVEDFLSQAKLLIETLKLDSDTPNFICVLPEKSRNMNIQFTNKYILVLNFETKTPAFWYLLPNKGENYYRNKNLKAVHSQVLAEKMQGGIEPIVLGFEAHAFDFEQDIKDIWLETAKNAFKSYKTSSKKNKFSHELYKLIINADYRQEIFAFAKSDQPIPEPAMQNKETNYNPNQILFGAPGTGKTYHTVNEAINIANPDFDTAQERAIVKAEFDRLVQEGQIMFVTFHQNFSYEDFVEGIKPITHNGHITYEIQDGIFKRMCVEAMYDLYKLQKERKKQKKDTLAINFDHFWLSFLQYIHQKQSILTKRKTELVLMKKNDNISIRLKTHNGTQERIVLKNNIEKLYETFESIDKIDNVLVDIHKVIGGTNYSTYSAYWAVFNELKAYEKVFLQDKIDEQMEDNGIGDGYEEEVITDYQIKKSLIADFDFQSVSEEVWSEAPKYVLIIDEINRGNVAQIFGELITLIEPSKRAGAEEALEVVLPYSKESFSVPKNLYIIGTMNTADRSVEALDTALRRRFVFKEMRPDYSLLPADAEGVNVQKLLETINQRIEILLDKDHVIGHSYFIGVETLEELSLAFEHKLIPLLQEYFFSDFAKIGLVLGDAFVTKKDNKGKFALFKGIDKYTQEDLESRQVFAFTAPDSWTKEAFESIYK